MDGSHGYEPRVYYTPTMGYDAGSSGRDIKRSHYCLCLSISLSILEFALSCRLTCTLYTFIQ